MLDYRNIIKNITTVKVNIEKAYYKHSEILKNDIQAVRAATWKGVTNIADDDLSNLIKIQEFLIDKVCKIHETENEKENVKIFNKNINIKSIKNKLIEGKSAAKIYFFNNSNYEYYFIGDLHSDDFILNKILACTNFFSRVCKGEKIRLIFLGDYVDRGKCHIKLLDHILLLKYIFPENIFLLRGNHDGGSLIEGKIKLWVRKPEAESDEDYFLLYMYNLSNKNNTMKLSIVDKYLEFFNSLCNIAFIFYKDISIMAVHGGIPRPRNEGKGSYEYIKSISDLTNEEIIDNINRTIVQNILWSDPYRGEGGLREDSGRFRFTLEHFEEFKEKVGFDILLRGHEAEEEGFKKYFNDRLVTIFSSGGVLENNTNINLDTAYEEVSPKMLRLNSKGKMKIIDIA